MLDGAGVGYNDGERRAAWGNGSTAFYIPSRHTIVCLSPHDSTGLRKRP